MFTFCKKYFLFLGRRFAVGGKFLWERSCCRKQKMFALVAVGFDAPFCFVFLRWAIGMQIRNFFLYQQSPQNSTASGRSKGVLCDHYYFTITLDCLVIGLSSLAWIGSLIRKKYKAQTKRIVRRRHWRFGRFSLYYSHRFFRLELPEKRRKGTKTCNQSFPGIGPILIKGSELERWIR